MKNLATYLNEELIFELSSAFLTRAAHAAVDKGDLRKVKIFMQGAKQRKQE